VPPKIRARDRGIEHAQGVNRSRRAERRDVRATGAGGQPASASFTAAMISLIATAPSPLRSAPAQASGAFWPRRC
jgi:hypothetical protein